MLDLSLLKKDLNQCNQDLDTHVQILEERLHGESFLKVDTLGHEKWNEIQFNYHSNLKPQFIFVRDSLKLLFSLCLKVKSPGTQSVDIFDLTNEINKSLFINKVQKIYLISIIEQGEHEIKKHTRLGKEFILLTQKIENKIDTLKLLNCFIDEKYVVNENSQTEPLKDSYDLINSIFDEYQFWEKPLEGVSELGDLNYVCCPTSKKALNRDDDLWLELIKSTYSDKGEPFLNLYIQIQTKTDQNDLTFPDLKKRKTCHSESSH